MFCPGGAGAARSTSSYNGPAGALETDAEPEKYTLFIITTLHS